jgi:hypothetical protein
MKGLSDRIQLNYERELEEKPPIKVSLNRIFFGSPGTGETSVAKLYGAILADMGLLSKGEGKSTSTESGLHAFSGCSPRRRDVRELEPWPGKTLPIKLCI